MAPVPVVQQTEAGKAASSELHKCGRSQLRLPRASSELHALEEIEFGFVEIRTRLNRPAELQMRLKRRDLRAGSALDDRFVEQALRQRRHQERRHAQPASRLAENRHVVDVAAERAHVALDPLQPGDLIEQTVVARSVTRFLAQERVREAG